MTLSSRLGLSYLVPEQAQKHVTVNESLRLLDTLVQMAAVQMNAVTPPSQPNDGDIYALANNPTGGWLAHAGKLAIFQDGAWVFLTPKNGWQLFNLSDNSLKVYVSGSWTGFSPSSSSSLAGVGAGLPAGLSMTALEVEHSISSGTYNDTRLIIPDRASVLGVSARVTQALNVRWKLGVSGGDDRYGSQIGKENGSTNIGVSSAPTSYYANTPIRITAQSGRFNSGRIKLKLYLLQLTLPQA